MAAAPSPQKDVLLARVFRAGTDELRAIAQGYGISGVNPELLMPAKNQIRNIVNAWSSEDFLERHNSYVAHINSLKGADREAALGRSRKPASATATKPAFTAQRTAVQPMKNTAPRRATSESPPVTDSAQPDKERMEQLVATGTAAAAEINKTLKDVNISLAEAVAANHSLREIITAEINRLQQSQAQLVNLVTQQNNVAMLRINTITATILSLMELHAKLCSNPA